jgi:predicted dienelactone hydrolase
MTYAAGLRTLFFADAARRSWDGAAPRPLLTDIWYPAADGAEERPVLIGPPEGALFQADSAAREAPLAAAPERFPLILLSHGTGGAMLQHGWLGAALARRGFIAAGVNHHGNTALEPYVAQGFVRLWERPLDLSAMLDQLLDDPSFGPCIDPARIGAAGFSAGGSTALALAGARFDLQALRRAYQETGRSLATLAPPEFPDGPALVALIERLADDPDHSRSYRDERVRAAFAIAPALGEATTPAGLAPIDVPVTIVVGDSDENTPPELNAMRYAAGISHARLVVLEGGVGHYTFLAEATALGRELLPALGVDKPGVDRAAVHRHVGELAATFFAQQLAGA